jgi:hypothetical protein
MNYPQSLLFSAQFAIVALLLPAGFILIAGGGLPGRRPATSAVAGLGGLALAAISYWACGFAFHMGGVGLTSEMTSVRSSIAVTPSSFGSSFPATMSAALTTLPS